MKLTPGQVQEILQLSPAALRHWKKALPPLGGRKGYTPCFSLGDLLAMATVKALTEDVGIPVGNLRALAGDLFEHCNRNSWTVLERSTFILEPLQGRLSAVPEGQPIVLDGLAVVLPCRPIILRLREHLLLEHEESHQEPWRFPPTAVAGKLRRGDA